MTKLTRLLFGSAATVVVLWLAWSALDRSWLMPREELLAQIDELEQSVAERERALSSQPRVQRQLREIRERTLGGDIESVDHILRSRLNRIVEDIGLGNFSVSTGSVSARQSPAARALFARRGSQIAFRDEVDFVELEGSVNGRGTLAQALLLVDRIDAVPWMSRIDSVTLTPRGNGDVFDVRVRMRTMFLPGASAPEPPEEQYDTRRTARYASLVQTNPFRVPPPPAPDPEPETPVEVVEAPQPPAAPPFPYGSWKLTGVAKGLEGAEIWLMNRSNGESRRMLVGGRIGDATLVGADGEFATFQLEETKFSVQVGSTLDERQPAGHNREV